MEERRKDVGLKLMYIIFTAILTLFLSAFFNKTYNIAESALSLSYENKKDIAVVQEWTKSVDKSLDIVNLKLDKLLGWNK